MMTKLFVRDIKTINGKDLLNLSPNGKIDLLAGCPPCQGFTSLTAKYKREDPRNTLINEMLRLIKEIRPTAIMMENVPGLAQRGKHLFDPVLKSLEHLGYQVSFDVLQVADYGVPQFRRRLVMLAGLGFKIPLPKPSHANGNPALPKWRTVRETIGHLSSPLTFSQAKQEEELTLNNWHVVRDITEQSKKRLKATKPGQNWSVIPVELRPPCHQGEYRGFSNVYGRMEYRTISVREAAMLQTFPQDYIIATPFIDHACKIIGNALPCKFAESVSRQCLQYLKK